MEKEGRPHPYVKSLYYFAKISGLAPFSLKNTIVCDGSLCDRLWPIIALTIHVIGLSGLILLRMNFGDGTANALSQAGDILSLEVGLVALVISILAVLYRRNNILQIVRLFLTIDHSFESMGIRQDYDGTFKKHAIFVGLSFCFVMFCELQVDIVSALSLNFELTLCSFIVLITGILIYSIYHFIVLSFLSVVVLTKKRYEQLNHQLAIVYLEGKKPSGFRRPRRIERNQLSSNVTTVNVPVIFSFEILLDEELTPLQKLMKIEYIHGKLHDLTEKIMDLFSSPLLAIIGMYFVTIVANCFFVYIGLTSAEDQVGVGEALSSMIWMTGFVAELCAIGAVCTSAQDTGNSAAEIIGKLWINHRPIEIIHEIQMLSLQLLQRPLTISAFGFFSLDYSYLYKIFCAVVAYFVIMVQLDTSKADSGPTMSTLNVTEIN